MINRVHHVGIVVSDLDRALEVYRRIFDVKPSEVKQVIRGKLRVAFIPVGNGEIELIQPLGTESVLGKYLRTHGEGIHHFSLATDDIESDVKRLRERGALFMEDCPTIGAHGVPIIFTRPETTGGVSIELLEQKEARVQPI